MNEGKESRLRSAVVTVYWILSAVYLLYVISLLYDHDDYAGPKLWYYTWQGARRVAYAFGRLGIEAEANYYSALDKRG